jgi:hypothetical protein
MGPGVQGHLEGGSGGCRREPRDLERAWRAQEGQGGLEGPGRAWQGLEGLGRAWKGPGRPRRAQEGLGRHERAGNKPTS